MYECEHRGDRGWAETSRFEDESAGHSSHAPPWTLEAAERAKGTQTGRKADGGKTGQTSPDPCTVVGNAVTVLLSVCRTRASFTVPRA